MQTQETHVNKTQVDVGQLIFITDFRSLSKQWPDKITLKKHEKNRVWLFFAMQQSSYLPVWMSSFLISRSWI